MKGWLLDTNVVSELGKRQRNVAVQIWVDAQAETTLYLSVVSLAEIRFGIERATSEVRRRDLLHWLQTSLRPWFANTTVDLDEDTLLEWRSMVDAVQAAGRPVGAPDLLIAATAKLHKFCVATRNASEFAQAGVAVFNPWDNVLHLPGRKPAKLNGVVTLDRLR